MNHPTLLKWIVANALGLGIGFFAYLQTGFLLDYGLDFSLHWQSDIPPSRDLPLVAVLTIPTMLVVAGVVLGFAQGLILRSFKIHMGRWIVTTSIGFLLLAVILVPLEHAGILGNIPGPVEPILFTVGGCSLAGVTQYVALRKRSVQASRWLTLWTGGLIISIIPTALMLLILQRLLGLSIIWPVEVFLNGMMCAGVAAWISGKALFSAISIWTTNA